MASGTIRAARPKGTLTAVSPAQTNYTIIKCDVSSIADMIFIYLDILVNTVSSSLLKVGTLDTKPNTSSYYNGIDDSGNYIQFLVENTGSFHIRYGTASSRFRGTIVIPKDI